MRQYKTKWEELNNYDEMGLHHIFSILLECTRIMLVFHLWNNDLFFKKDMITKQNNICQCHIFSTYHIFIGSVHYGHVLLYLLGSYYVIYNFSSNTISLSFGQSLLQRNTQYSNNCNDTLKVPLHYSMPCCVDIYILLSIHSYIDW